MSEVGSEWHSMTVLLSRLRSIFSSSHYEAGFFLKWGRPPKLPWVSWRRKVLSISRRSWNIDRCSDHGHIVSRDPSLSRQSTHWHCTWGYIVDICSMFISWSFFFLSFFSFFSFSFFLSLFLCFFPSLSLSVFIFLWFSSSPFYSFPFSFFPSVSLFFFSFLYSFLNFSSFSLLVEEVRDVGPPRPTFTHDEHVHVQWKPAFQVQEFQFTVFRL